MHKAWPGLHAGDQEPYPDATRAQALVDAAGKAAKPLASQLQAAWRAFHGCDFQCACHTGSALGALVHRRR